jgi:sodium/proline symporter
MSIANLGMLLAIGIYLLGMITVGIRFSKKNENTDDFFIGGRKLGPFVTAMSAEASDMSSWLLMGLPGVAYLSGTADVAWTAIGLAVGTWFNWLLVAKKLRRYTEKTGSITVPAFFSNRYHDDRRILQLVAAVWIVVFFVPYTASGFAACGADFVSQSLGLGESAVQNGDLGAALRQSANEFAAEHTGAAGDNCDLAGEIRLHGKIHRH